MPHTLIAMQYNALALVYSATEFPIYNTGKPLPARYSCKNFTTFSYIKIHSIHLAYYNSFHCITLEILLRKKKKINLKYDTP